VDTAEGTPGELGPLGAPAFAPSAGLREACARAWPSDDGTCDRISRELREAFIVANDRVAIAHAMDASWGPDPNPMDYLLPRADVPADRADRANAPAMVPPPLITGRDVSIRLAPGVLAPPPVFDTDDVANVLRRLVEGQVAQTFGIETATPEDIGLMMMTGGTIDDSAGMVTIDDPGMLTVNEVRRRANAVFGMDCPAVEHGDTPWGRLPMGSIMGYWPPLPDAPPVDAHPFQPWCYCSPCVKQRRVAGKRAEEVAAALLGPELWETAKRQRYLDVPSSLHAGTTYRVWWGRSIEVFTDTERVWAVPRRATRRPPWRRARWRRGPNAPVAGQKTHAYNLCVGPATLMPVAEAFAHLYLYARDCPARLHACGNDVGFSSFATPNTF